MEQATVKKSKKGWIIAGVITGLCLLGVIGIIVLVAMAGKLLTKTVKFDTALAAQSAHEIMDYDLPDGYAEQMSMVLLGTRMVMVSPVDDMPGPIFMLAQYEGTSNLSPDEMEEQLQQAMQQQWNQKLTDLHEVERRPVKVRGSETEAVITEGVSSGGVTMRQLSVVFPGKNGIAMLMLSATPDQWDEELIYGFIDSFR